MIRFDTPAWARRNHYVLPLRLHLTVSLIVLLAMRLPVEVRLGNAEAIRIDAGTEFALFGYGVAQPGLGDGRFCCENIPQSICRRMPRLLRGAVITLVHLVLLGLRLAGLAVWSLLFRLCARSLGFPARQPGLSCPTYPGRIGTHRAPTLDRADQSDGGRAGASQAAAKASAGRGRSNR